MRKFVVIFLLISCAKEVKKVEEVKKEEKIDVVSLSENMSADDIKKSVAPDPIVVFNIALRKDEKGELEDAGKLYEYAINLNPNFPEAYLNLAEIKRKKGDIDGAIQVLEEGFKISKDVLLWSGLINLYSEKGDFKKAEELIKDATRYVGIQKEIVTSLAYSLIKRKSYFLAIFVLDELEKKYPEDTTIKKLLGIAWFEIDCQKSIEKFSAIEEKTPEILNNIGFCYEKLGKIEKAEENYKKVISKNPNFFPAYLNLGNIYKKKGQWEKAEELYKRALEIKEGDPNAIYNLANLYETMASEFQIQPHKALPYISKAIDMLSQYQKFAQKDELELIQRRIDNLKKTEERLKKKLEKEIKK